MISSWTWVCRSAIYRHKGSEDSVCVKASLQHSNFLSYFGSLTPPYNTFHLNFKRLFLGFWRHSFGRLTTPFDFFPLRLWRHAFGSLTPLSFTCHPLSWPLPCDGFKTANFDRFKSIMYLKSLCNSYGHFFLFLLYTLAFEDFSISF